MFSLGDVQLQPGCPVFEVAASSLVLCFAVLLVLQDLEITEK